MFRSLGRLQRSRDGAVAPTVALSLFALIAAGGIAFDYARLAALDTELQQAADQAALAGATQLDQETGAIERATAAAQALIGNDTRFANDGNASGIDITVPTVIFYTTKANAEADTNGFTDTTRFEDARFIRVAVATRQARYALTPVVGALASGNISAEAVAGLGSAICKTPPVMICNPTETVSNTSFDPASYIGRGIKLVSVGNSGGAWVPGNFGYLNSGGGSNGASGLREALGWTTPPGNCLSGSGVDTKPGASVSVTDALNTRFDVYDGNTSCPTGGACPASVNSVKDVVRAGDASGGNACRLHNQGWKLLDGYYGRSPTPNPSDTGPLPVTSTPRSMGHPRDICHAVSTAGTCTNGVVGDGVWDRDAYFRTNYVRGDGTYWTADQWRANTGLSTIVATTASNYASRYNVYTWEIANRGLSVDGVTVLGPRIIPGTGTGASAIRGYGQSQCSVPEGHGPAVVPGATSPDRRRISVAVVNCLANNVNGNSTNVPVKSWLEAFLVEPSVNRERTGQGDVYIEVIGETQAGGAGATAGQVVRRDVPYLVK